MYNWVKFLSALNILCIFCLFSACEGTDLVGISGVELLEIDNCFIPNGQEWVLDSGEDFNALFSDYNANGECDIAILPTIDFSQRTVLAKLTDATTCSTSYIREVFADTSQDKYIYRLIISLNNTNDCTTSQHRHFNWISIPKLPKNYDVDFQVEYKIL